MFEIRGGDGPDLNPGDEVTSNGEIRRGDVVCFERIGPHEVRLRSVSQSEQFSYEGSLYRIDRGTEPGAMALEPVDASGAEALGVPEAFARVSPLVRDTSLSAHVTDRYRVGMLFREPTFCDATYKLGALTAVHRYLIFSGEARNLDGLSANPQWGLCVHPTGSIFKVLDNQRDGSTRQTILLCLPETFREQLIATDLEPWEAHLVESGRNLFQQARRQLPRVKEVAGRDWLDRLTHPLGIDDEGSFFEAWYPDRQV